MPKQIAYFDSQASAAASLGSIFTICARQSAKDAPHFGPAAFIATNCSSGLKGSASAREKGSAMPTLDDEMVSASDWNDRRSILFDVLAFLHDAYVDKRIDLVKYAELGEATVEQMIKLGEVWEAGIDAPGWRKTWKACLAEAILQKNQENKRSTRRN